MTLTSRCRPTSLLPAVQADVFELGDQQQLRSIRRGPALTYRGTRIREEIGRSSAVAERSGASLIRSAKAPRRLDNGDRPRLGKREVSGDVDLVPLVIREVSHQVGIARERETCTLPNILDAARRLVLGLIRIENPPGAVRAETPSNGRGLVGASSVLARLREDRRREQTNGKTDSASQQDSPRPLLARMRARYSAPSVSYC